MKQVLESVKKQEKEDEFTESAFDESSEDKFIE